MAMKQLQKTLSPNQHILYIDGLEIQYKFAAIYWDGERYTIEINLGWRSENYFIYAFDMTGSSCHVYRTTKPSA